MNNWPKQYLYEVADNIVAVINGQGEMGVANATFIIDGKNAFVVDTMTHPEMVAGMVQHIRQRNVRVTTVLNTHHHVDHIGGNTAFADAHIIAHPSSIPYMRKISLFSDKFYNHLLPQFHGSFADFTWRLPEALDERMELPQGGRLYAFPDAHTPMDLVAWFPASRTLLTGDLCFINVVPMAVHGLISGWIEALEALIALKPAIVIPGHGPVGTLKDLVILKEYMTSVQSAGKLAVKTQLSLQDALVLVESDSVASWIEAERTKTNVERAMQEARGEIHRGNLATLPLSGKK